MITSELLQVNFPQEDSRVQEDPTNRDNELDEVSDFLQTAFPFTQAAHAERDFRATEPDRKTAYVPNHNDVEEFVSKKAKENSSEHYGNKRKQVNLFKDF